jgi:hypothetical protein
MEYKEEEAFAIARKFSLSAVTVKVWKNRGRIPDKYEREDYRLRRPAQTPAELADYNRGMRILQSEKINTAELLRRAALPKHRFLDACRPDERRVELDYDQYLALKKELQRLRTQIRTVTEKMVPGGRYTPQNKVEIDKLVHNDLIVVAKLFNYDPKKDDQLAGSRLATAYQRVSGRKHTVNFVHEDWEVDFALDRLTLFMLETSI